jgi:hypothetical protein
VDMSNGREVPLDPSKLKGEEWKESKHQPADEPAFQELDDETAARRVRSLLARETRMETFLNDPCTSVKVYLTSYARDRGFYW